MNEQDFTRFESTMSFGGVSYIVTAPSLQAKFDSWLDWKQLPTDQVR